MFTRSTVSLFVLSLSLLVACGGKQDLPDTETAVETPSVEAVAEEVTDAQDENLALRAALEHPLRTENEKARDAYRHPYETLSFFGVTPESHVLELWAGSGWYTHVLAPYVAGTGKLHVTTFPADAEVEYFKKLSAKMHDYVGKVENGDKINVIAATGDSVELGLEGEVDVALTFRNVHNWVKGDYDKAVYEAAFKALKPGGVFGVVEHRGPEGMTREESATSGYMDQAQVIADIEAVGFTFVESSEVNANAADTKDHPAGVWTLPPTLRLGEEDQAKYVAIGESDRMTLKFVKPKD